jgi:hypothetical protein
MNWNSCWKMNGKWVNGNPCKAEEQTCPVSQKEEGEIQVLMILLQTHHAMERCRSLCIRFGEGVGGKSQMIYFLAG